MGYGPVRNLVVLGLQISGRQGSAKVLCSTWCADMMKNCNSRTGEEFKDCLVSVLGRGDTVKFWEDIWHMEARLRDQFPLLYKLSTAKGSALESMGS